MCNDLSLVCRCEAPGEPAVRGEHSGAGEQRSARVHALLLPSVSGSLQSAHTAAPWGPVAQRAGRGLPVLQAPVRRSAVQQSAHRNASRQEVHRRVKVTLLWEFKPYVRNGWWNSFPKAILSYLKWWMYRIVSFVFFLNHLSMTIIGGREGLFIVAFSSSCRYTLG